jgi:sec-independent protein translocase protein TatA
MLTNFALLDFSTPDLVLILAIVLLLFGGKKLPELSRTLGESARELKKTFSSADKLHKEVKGQLDDIGSELSGNTAERQE